MIYYNPLCIYKNSEVLVTLENTGLLAQLHEKQEQIYLNDVLACLQCPQGLLLKKKK